MDLPHAAGEGSYGDRQRAEDVMISIGGQFPWRGGLGGLWLDEGAAGHGNADALSAGPKKRT